MHTPATRYRPNSKFFTGKVGEKHCEFNDHAWLVVPSLEKDSLDHYLISRINGDTLQTVRTGRDTGVRRVKKRDKD